MENVEKYQFMTIDVAGETFLLSHQGFFKFFGAGFWAGIPGVVSEIGKSGALNIGVGKSWKIKMGGGEEMYVINTHDDVNAIHSESTCYHTVFLNLKLIFPANLTIVFVLTTGMS